MMTKEEFAEEFIGIFRGHEVDYAKHLHDYGEVLGHVFFGNLINPPLFRLLRENTEKALIGKYVQFIERMYLEGDDAVKNIVEVTILEYLGDDSLVLKNAFALFSDALIEASKQVESALRRRTIIISHKNGETLTRW